MQRANYLTALLPKGINVIDEMTKRLTNKDLRSLRGKEYTRDIVMNGLYKKNQDDNIDKELLAWVLETNEPATIVRFITEQRIMLNRVETELLEAISVTA